MEKDDLLNIKPKKNLKKPLIYGAIAFLIFIIAVIAYAIYSNAKEENVVLPPQVNSQPKQENTEFKEVPIEDNTTVLSQKLLVADNTSNNEKEKKSKNISEKSTNKSENNVTKISEKPQAESKNISLKENRVKSEIKKRNVKKITGVKYYIQVAALMKYKRPNRKFLDLIKREGFNYTYYHTYIIKNGRKIPITKILIGPFENEKIARMKLKIVKEKITQNAFIFKVK